MIDKLKSCPFCGGEAHIAENVGYRGDIAYTVNCNAVYGCIASDSGLWYSSREAAVEAWNTRADDYRQAAEYWQRMYEEAFAERTCHEVMVDRFFRGCSECGYMWEYMYGIGKRERPNYCPNCGAKVVG